jgi:hypothetical protein
MQPIKSTTLFKRFFFFALFVSITLFAPAQMITGVWHGKIGGQKVEVKIVQNGDSLAGTSYYYASANNYQRYTIKGYFDVNTNSAVWWDDHLIESKKGLLGAPGKVPQLSVADFNCPGGGEMFLEGKAAPKEQPEKTSGVVGLTKVAGPNFTDEWDEVIDNYTTGTNDPHYIDSIALLSTRPRSTPVPPTVPPAIAQRPVISEPALTEPAANPGPATINEKFTVRKKIFTKEIPVEGEFIELRFYDNAQVDGDSISLFLDDKLIFQHIRLSEQAYTIKLAVDQLKTVSELIMVAENLGTIPPNTSYMVAIVGDKRYETKLSSSENSSALIRLKKGN